MTQFSGESNWDAIVNYASLNIEEEQDFLEFCTHRLIAKTARLEVLRGAFVEWATEADVWIPSVMREPL